MELHLRKPPSRGMDRNGRRIQVGDAVMVARNLGAVGVNRDFQKAFRRVAGRVTTVVGWDSTGAAWIPFTGGGVLSVEPHLLSVLRRAALRGGMTITFTPCE
jgi:hypothetical protein